MKLESLPKEVQEQLKGCLQTEITTADGETMVLFHMEPLEADEIAELEKLTYAELKAILGASFRNPRVYELTPTPATGLSTGPDADKGGSDSPTSPQGADGSRGM